MLKHKKEGKSRDFILLINGSGFKDGQIDELKEKVKSATGIHIIDLHDKQYDKYWKEIDQECKKDGNPLNIKKYFSDLMYIEDRDDRIFFAITIDTFRYIAGYILLRQQQDNKKSVGLMYSDFDALGYLTEYIKAIGQDITIPYEILGTTNNNDVFCCINSAELKKIIDSYKHKILSQKVMSEKLNIPVKELYKVHHCEVIDYNFAQVAFIDAMKKLMLDEYEFDQINFLYLLVVI